MVFLSLGCIWFPSIAVSVPHGHVANEIVYDAAAQCCSHQRPIDGIAVEGARGVDYPGDAYNGQF